MLTYAKVEVINIVSNNITDNTLSSVIRHIYNTFDLTKHKIFMIFQREHISLITEQNILLERQVKFLEHMQYTYCNDVKYEHSE